MRQRGRAGLGQPFIDGLIGDRKAGIVPEALIGQQAPEGELAGEAPQHADQQATPEGQGRHDPRPAGLTWVGVELQGLDQRPQERFDIVQVGWLCGGGRGRGGFGFRHQAFLS